MTQTWTVPESLERLVCLSITYDRVTGDRLATIAPDDPIGVARELQTTDRLTECIILSTCNRVEVYASTRTAADEDRDRALSAITETLDRPDGSQVYTGLAVVEHLFRVACGLESAVLGEDQILGQVRETFDRAAEANVAGGVLSRVADAAIRVGRAVRDQTAINDGTVSYGSAICEAIHRELEDPPDRVLIIGAGEMATTAIDAIEERWDARIDVANRTPKPDLVTSDGACWPLTKLQEALQPADAVVTATGASDPILTRSDVRGCDPGTPIVDLANPADVDEEVRGTSVVVTDLEDIATYVQANADERRDAIDEVEQSIDDAIQRLLTRELENRAEDTLRELHRQAATVRERELERALRRLEEGEADPETVLEDFASSLTGSLLADPTDALRTAAREGDTTVIDAAEWLFDLSTDGSNRE
ncbi:MAG: glutamyl-tRNA reductase [Halobacteriales archaeon]|nr:glutamyl-tRNA reductase [Halobacteriales archaeon]